jgi:molecular chaperone DnaJ
MNVQQACLILDVEEGASKEEVDKAFRKKAATMHPDVNKQESAEADFKQLNEAYQYLKQNGTEPEPFSNMYTTNVEFDLNDFAQRQAINDMFRDMASGFGFHVRNPGMERKGKIIISFEESILGGEKEVTYKRTIKCNQCNGGQVAGGPKTLCPKCNGKKTRHYPGKDKDLPCTFCKATGYVQGQVLCGRCNGTGSAKVVENAIVKIPPGADATKKIRLPGRGDYYGVNGFFDAVFDVVVSPHREFYREGDNVVSVIDIDLLDALKGINKRVSTVKGDKTLKIKAGIRHKDSVQVKGFGVPPNGSHVFVVHVKYPENTDALIKALEETSEEPEVISGDEGE